MENTTTRKETGRDIAIRVCRYILDGKIKLSEIRPDAATALGLENDRIARDRVRAERNRREQERWDRARRREDRKQHERKSKLGKLLALRNKVAAFLQDNFTNKTGRFAGVRRQHAISFGLSEERLVIFITKKVWQKEPSFGRWTKADLRSQAKAFRANVARLKKVKSVFGGRFEKKNFSTSEYSSTTGKPYVDERFERLLLVWRKA